MPTVPTPSLDFGLFISVFLPGIVIVAGLASFSGSVRAIMTGFHGTVSEKAGSALLVGMLSLISGLCIGALRATFWVPLDIDYCALADEGVRGAFLLAHEHRRFHQFYGNMFFSLPIWGALFFGWGSKQRKERIGAAIVVVCLTILMWWGAHRTLSRFHRALETLHALRTAEAHPQPCGQQNKK